MQTIRTGATLQQITRAKAKEDIVAPIAKHAVRFIVSLQKITGIVANKRRRDIPEITARPPCTRFASIRLVQYKAFQFVIATETDRPFTCRDQPGFFICYWVGIWIDVFVARNCQSRNIVAGNVATQRKVQRCFAQILLNRPG